MGKPESICVFGDSTAWGAWDLEKGGWVTRLWADVGLRDEDYVEIYNVSISGGTSESILARFENEARVRHADAIIFQTGANDATYRSTPDNVTVSPEKFRLNLERLIAKARQITQTIAFIDLRNCDESKTMPVSWDDVYCSNENFTKYGKIMEEVCQTHEVPFLEIGSLNDEDFEDGLHPNAEGHRKIFEKVKNFLIEQQWI